MGDILGLAPNSGILSLVTNSKGGIIDDTVITNAGDYIYMVVNGATKFGDMKHFEEQMASFDGEVCMDYLGDAMQLLALQGPGAAAAVAKLLPSGFDLSKMPFMSGVDTTLDGIPGCRITRYVIVGVVLVVVCHECMNEGLSLYTNIAFYTIHIYILLTVVVTLVKMGLKLPCLPNMPCPWHPNSWRILPSIPLVWEPVIPCV